MCEPSQVGHGGESKRNVFLALIYVEEVVDALNPTVKTPFSLFMQFEIPSESRWELQNIPRTAEKRFPLKEVIDCDLQSTGCVCFVEVDTLQSDSINILLHLNKLDNDNVTFLGTSTIDTASLVASDRSEKLNRMKAVFRDDEKVVTATAMAYIAAQRRWRLKTAEELSEVFGGGNGRLGYSDKCMGGTQPLAKFVFVECDVQANYLLQALKNIIRRIKGSLEKTTQGEERGYHIAKFHNGNTEEFCISNLSKNGRGNDEVIFVEENLKVLPLSLHIKRLLGVPNSTTPCEGSTEILEAAMEAIEVAICAVLQELNMIVKYCDKRGLDYRLLFFDAETNFKRSDESFPLAQLSILADLWRRASWALSHMC